MSLQTVDIIDIMPGEQQARLMADDYFADIPVVIAEPGLVKAMSAARAAAVNAAQGSAKKGVAVVIAQIEADDDFPNLQFGPMTLRLAFIVVEQVEMNNGPSGIGKSCRQVARRIVIVMKTAGFQGLIKVVKPGKPCIHTVPLLPELEAANLVARQVNFDALEDSLEQLQQCSAPQWSVTGNQLTITSATAGAQIYYTLDDSYPSKFNPSPLVYTDPITIPPQGFTIRACAYLAGYVASWVMRAKLQPAS